MYIVQSRHSNVKICFLCLTQFIRGFTGNQIHIIHRKPRIN